MNNLTLIRRYISQNYELYVDNSVKILDKFTGGNIRINHLVDETNQIFDFDCTKICNKWYDTCFNRETKDIQNYLSNYRVRLGSRNWETLDKDNNFFEIREMVKHFSDKYHEKFIRETHNNWYLKKIQKEVEKIIKINDLY